ncbi:PIN domain nuclease [bacterium]|nr:PIN domain nuclease [bacterium]
MILVDTSAWIEYFRNGNSTIVRSVDTCLDRNLIIIGDLIYCEIMQGIKIKREREKVSSLLLSLPQYEMVGFHIAQKSAMNYRNLRSKGVTVRKTIDVIIGTFCVENNLKLVHFDRDFDFMASHIGLEIYNL